MAEEKKKAIQKDQETIMPTESTRPGEELSEKDLDKASGGDLKHKDIVQ